MAAERIHAADYFSRVFALRYFWLSLVKNDLQNRYRRSFLGVAWSLVRPIGMTIVIATVFTNAFNVTVAEYAPFLFLGIAMWQFLVQSMMTGCNTFKTGAAFIRQQPMPLIIYPLRTVLAAGVNTAAAFTIALGLTGYFVGVPSMPVLASVVPGIALLFILAVALATLVGIVHIYLPDTQYVLEIALQALFYLTPVMYRPDTFAEHRELSGLLTWNPFTAVLELVRQPLLCGHYPEPAYLLQALMFVGILSGLAWYCLRRCEDNLVFWI
jgi:lipopolysaccharide transport system permease protein